MRCDLGGVNLTGALEPEPCQFVMAIPCITTVGCFVKNSECKPYCETGLTGKTGWRIVEEDHHGLKVTPRFDGADEATIEPIGSLADVIPGSITIEASGASGGVKTATLFITVDIEGGGCSAGVCPNPVVDLGHKLIPTFSGAFQNSSVVPFFQSRGQAPNSPFTVLGATYSGNQSVSTRFHLGRSAFGKFAGNASLHHAYPTNKLSKPDLLRWSYGTNTGCEVLPDATVIRQIRSGEGLADVVTSSAYKYSINYFPTGGIGSKVGGFYQTSGVPLLTVTVENPDTSGNTTNQLRVTDGYGYVSDYLWQTNGWELTTGGGLRRERKAITWNGGNTYRTNTVEVRNSDNQLIASSSATSQAFSFGTNLVEETVGQGSDAHSTTYSWHTTGVGATGKLAQVNYPDGRWERHAYSTTGWRTNTCLAFLNQAATDDLSLCRSIEYRYGTNWIPGAPDTGRSHLAEPRCTIEYIQGHEVARSYLVLPGQERREIRCVHPGAAWDNASNLVTITRWYTNGPHLQRVWNIQRPDGTMDFFQFGFYTNGAGESFQTNIVLSGAPDSYKTNIVEGTKATTVLGAVGQIVSHTTIDVASVITTSSLTYSVYDDFNRPRKVTYLDGTFDWTDYGCCGPTTQTNREGIVTTYYTDAMNRVTAAKQNGITQTNVLDASHRVLNVVRVGSDSSRITNATHTYSTSGERLTSEDALGNITSFAEATVGGQLFRTNTYPDGSIRIESFYDDGQLAKVTGTAAHPVRYDYGVEEEPAGSGVWRGFSKEIKLDGSGADTAEWTKTYRDMAGRSFKTVYPDGASRQSLYNVKGQLVRQIDPDGVSTVSDYNARGEVECTGTDVNRNGTNDFSGTDRIRQSLRLVTTNGGINVQQVKTFVWSTNNSATSNLTALTQTSADGLRTWQSAFGLTNFSHINYAGGGNRYVTNTAADGSYSVSHYANSLLKSLTRKSSDGTELSQSTYFYDAHGRQYALTDARTGTTTHSFDNADRIASTTSPAPGNGQSPQTTAYTHDWAGRVIRTTLADGASSTNEYHPTGELKKTTGARAYPVQYGYDAQGRRTNMITWKNLAADSGKATTTWRYDTNRGFLLAKIYDDGKGTTNGYTAGGRLRTRTWARGVVTTYHTNAAGEVFATTYSDATPAVTHHQDRLGRSTNIIDGAGNRFMTYTVTGQLLHETNSTGTLIGQNFRFAYDEFLRRTNLQLYATNSCLVSNSYVFDGASRMTNISDGTYQAGYSYLANSPLISQITYLSNSALRMTTTRAHDYLNRLSSISSQPSASGVGPISSGYAYNDANQRTRVNLEDGSFWLYEYDALGQLISGKRYWNDWTPVAGQQHEYAFDDIGNRSSTKAGGDASGAGLRSANYTANNLNQCSSRDVPGAADVVGIAHASATVSLNSQSPYRRGEYFWKELSVNNGSAAVWQPVTNIGSLTGTSQTNTGNLFLPKTAESYTYDADGNLTSDGRWTNKWDAENRLVDMTSHASGPSASRKSLQFAYDSQGRRYSKIVSNWTGSAWTRALHEKFLYDGWNLVGVLNGTNDSILKSFLWGLDLSGSLQGAGGVAGLIAFASRQAPVGTHFVAYDGNGNVRALVAGDTGDLSGRYEYDPFGQTIRASGTIPALNPVRFSSKHADDETDFAYYGYRYLNPNSGRWLSRDPIEERGLCSRICGWKRVRWSDLRPHGGAS